MRVPRVAVYSIIAVVVLAFLSGGGFLAYRYFLGDDTQAIPFAENNSALIPQPDPNDPPITPFRELHEAMLRMPDPDASEGARESYRALLDKYAKQQTNFTIKECKPDPLAIKVKTGSEITIKNDDDTQHLITVNAQSQVTVPAKGSAKLTTDFGKGNGIYTYRCDSDEAHVGIILVKGEL